MAEDAGRAFAAHLDCHLGEIAVLRQTAARQIAPKVSSVTVRAASTPSALRLSSRVSLTKRASRSRYSGLSDIKRFSTAV